MAQPARAGPGEARCGGAMLAPAGPGLARLGKAMHGEIMTRTEYKLALKFLGWPQIELCRRLGLSKNTPARWRPDVPEYIASFLSMAVKAKKVLE